MPDTTGVTNIFLPELQYAFRRYWRSYGDLPLENYIKIPEIDHSDFYIKSNNIFDLLFDNNYGLDITGPDPDTTSYDVSGVYDNYYVITDDET